MEYITVTRSIVKTKEQKLLENKTVQWFLYGDPDHFKKIILTLAGEWQNDLEQQMKNTLLYGTSHPEMYKE